MEELLIVVLIVFGVIGVVMALAWGIAVVADLLTRDDDGFPG